MRILTEEDLNKSIDEIVSKSYNVCKNAKFPVDESDVYNHLYGSDGLVSSFLVNDNNEIVGFGVVQNYNLEINELSATLAYLHGMVIAKEYQGRGYSTEMLRLIYQYFQSDFFGLRTQNPKMAMSMLNLFKKILIRIPTNTGNDLPKYVMEELLNLIRQIPPYQDIDDNGILRNCYPNQLYPDLDELKVINSNIDLKENDALAVIVQPETTTSRILLQKK
ncbi:MAG: GNAT family N-acetyltransferase [Bacilli bacterium]|nr:GNAT family N-acetyltransferase [Bacilli bacterium]